MFHDLIIGDVDADNVAGDLRTDQHRPAIDKGIVRALVVPGMKIPCDAGDDADDDQSKADDHRDRMLSECALDALGTLLLSLIGFWRLSVGFSILWICLRFLGPDVDASCQAGSDVFVGPLLG